MSSKTSNDRPQATARAAEIVREYGPFPGADRIARRHPRWPACLGRHRGQAGRLRSRKRRAHAHDRPRLRRRHRLRRQAPLSDRRGTHRQDRSRHRRRGGLDPGARQRGRLGAHLGRRQPVGRRVPRSQDPPDRSGNRRHPANHRVRPLRHRRDLGRRRAVARNLGRGRQRHPPDRPGQRRRARASRDAARHRRQRAGIRRRGSLLCGGGASGKVRAVRRPKSRSTS